MKFGPNYTFFNVDFFPQIKNHYLISKGSNPKSDCYFIPFQSSQSLVETRASSSDQYIVTSRPLPHLPNKQGQNDYSRNYKSEKWGVGSTVGRMSQSYDTRCSRRRESIWLLFLLRKAPLSMILAAVSSCLLGTGYLF